MGERLEFATDLRQTLADGAGLAIAEGASEFGVTHVRRALDGERETRDRSRASQSLVLFYKSIRANSSLSMLSPDEVDAQYHQSQQAAHAA